MKDYIEACLHMSRAPEFKFQKSLPGGIEQAQRSRRPLTASWKGARVRVLMSRYKESLVDAQQRF